MKSLGRCLLTLWSAVWLTGCEYERPLSTERILPVDTPVLGIWEQVPGDGQESRSMERMMILKHSANEYFVHYPLGNDGVYYRAWPIRVGGVACVQLEAIGTKDGPLKAEDVEIYHVVSYRLEGDMLEVRTLNTEVVDDDLKTTEALQKAFVEQRNHPDLFHNPGRFKRVRP